MRTTWIAIFPFLVACGSTKQEAFSLSLDPEGASVLRVDTNDGDITVAGAETLMVEVAGLSVGQGLSQERAAEALAGNAWGAALLDGVVSVWGSASHRGTVDLHVAAPHDLSADVVAAGVVVLDTLEGSHVVTADRIVARGLAGDADLYARNRGLDIALDPRDGTSVRLQSHGGDVIVTLPVGFDYDLTILADPAFDLRVDDLGFDFSHLAVGSFVGERGAGTVEVSVHVEGGNVTVRGSHTP